MKHSTPFHLFLCLSGILVMTAIGCQKSKSAAPSTGNGGPSTTDTTKPSTTTASYTVDTSYAKGDIDGEIMAAALGRDGRIIIAGIFTHFEGAALNHIARLNADGTIDKSFSIGTGFNGLGIILDIKIQSNGQILVFGDFTTYNKTACSSLVRLNTDGSLDKSFNPGVFTDVGNRTLIYQSKIAIQPDNNILIAGSFTKIGNVPVENIARITGEGKVDTSFTPWFQETSAMGITSDGRILVSTGNLYSIPLQQYRYNLARINADGSLDPSFTFSQTLGDGVGESVDGNAINNILPLEGNKYLISGALYHLGNTDCNGVARILGNGAIDPDFKFDTSAAVGPVNAIAILNNGDYLIGKGNPGSPYYNHVNLQVMGINGLYDRSFTAAFTNDNASVYALVKESNSSYIVTGFFKSLNGVACPGIARLKFK